VNRRIELKARCKAGKEGGKVLISRGHIEKERKQVSKLEAGKQDS
jgi:hypothetical protein